MYIVIITLTLYCLIGQHPAKFVNVDHPYPKKCSLDGRKVTDIVVLRSVFKTDTTSITRLVTQVTSNFE